MTANRSKILTWIIVALVIVVVLVQLALWVSSLREPPILLDVVQKIITETLLPLAFVIPGIMILNQQPENKVGWFMMIVGLSAVAP
jgi:cadmium resistance protein CadD (predicted permease)